MKSVKELTDAWQLEEDEDQKAILRIELDAAMKAAKEAKKVVEIPAALLASIVPNDPMAGWQPRAAFAPAAVSLLAQTKASKRSTPGVDDCRLEFKVANQTVKTYASNLLYLWQQVSKEDLFIQGSSEEVKVVNPKLKIGYIEDKESTNKDFRFKMVVAVK